MLHIDDVRGMCSESMLHSQPSGNGTREDDAMSSGLLRNVRTSGNERSHRPRTGDGGGVSQDNFLANDDLDEVEHVRAPGDLPPYSAALRTELHAIERCVACIYAQQAGPAEAVADVDQREQRAVFDEMLALINDNYQRGTSNHQLVDMVHAFYEREIKPYWDCGDWDKPAIWNHILYHMGDDRIQSTEIRSALLMQIQALREVTWIKRSNGDRNGACVPDHKTVRLMNELIKTHNTLFESAARRHQQSLQQQQRNASCSS